MIQFLAHEESLLTATIEWWSDGYFVTIFFPNGDLIPETCNDFMTMGDALNVAETLMDQMHHYFGRDTSDFPGEEESDIDWPLGGEGG